MIVIDSQGDLINKIRQLDGLNGDNTIIIDPEDVGFPVALRGGSANLNSWDKWIFRATAA
jgi:hypothetical protein